MVVFIIISLVMSVASLFTFFVFMKVLFEQQKQQVALNKRCKELDSNLKPIRLYFIVKNYNICIRNEDYECAGKILNIIKEQFPEDYDKMGFKC